MNKGAHMTRANRAAVSLETAPEEDPDPWVVATSTFTAVGGAPYGFLVKEGVRLRRSHPVVRRFEGRFRPAIASDLTITGAEK